MKHIEDINDQLAAVLSRKICFRIVVDENTNVTDVAQLRGC